MEQNHHKPLHVVMFPWLAMGHLIPFLHLSKLLASKGHKISFISTPRNLSRLSQILKIPISLNLVPIPFPQVPNLPEKAESSTDIPHQKAQALKIAFDLLKQPVFEFLENLETKPDWILYDYASHWLPSIGTQFGIRCAFFSLFNSANLAFIGPPYALSSEKYSRKTAEDFTIVPSWVPFDSKIVYRRHEVAKYMEGDDVRIKSELSDDKRFGLSIDKSDLVLVRTSVDFESNWFNLICELYQKPVIPIGFLPPGLEDNFDSEIEIDEKWLEIKDWLDKKPVDSVVYVALGTEATLSQDELTQLALGLDNSELPFFWVLRNSPGSSENPVDLLPRGFMERVKGRGRVYLDWAPQTKILSHPGIGGFLTHCGWNSVIEGLSYGRVLILFPVMNDQGLNARLLVGKGLSVEVPRAESDGFFTSDSVAETIRVAMVSEVGESVRGNAKEMKVLFGDRSLNERCIDNVISYLEENRKLF